LPDGSVNEEAYGVVYYGGVLDVRNATPVEVRSGETFAGADIPMGAGKMRASHIRGVVINGETGQPAAGAQVLAIPRQERPNTLVLMGTTSPTGAFDLAGALPDEYVLTATAVLPTTARIVPGPSPTVELFVGGSSLSVGYVPVDIGNSDANGVRIVTTSGFTISGQVAIEGKLPRDAEADLARMNIGVTRDPDLIGMPSALLPLPPPPPGTPRPAVIPPGNGQVTASGDFKMVVSPGDFRINVDRIPANAYVKSIRMGNVDILSGGLQLSGPPDSPIEVVLGIDGGEVTGTVVNDRLEMMTNVVVALVPESPLLRRRYDLYRSATSDYAGKFRLQNIPPGTYKLFSWDYVENDAWQDAQFLQPYETAGRIITVREGSSQQTQAKVSPVRR